MCGQRWCSKPFGLLRVLPGKVAAYALLHTLVALALLRPPSSLNLPTGTDETLAFLLRMATVGGAVGAATVIVATQLHRNSNGSQGRENQGAVWAILVVCGMLASTHVQQMFHLTVAFSNSETGFTVLPLQKMTKLSAQAITFTLMATACGVRKRLVWAIEAVVWIMNLTGFVLAFVDRSSVYHRDFMATSIFFVVLQIVVTGLLGRVSCARVTVGPASGLRPVALVAKVMIPVVIVCMWCQTAAQIVLLYGVIATTIADIAQAATDSCMVIVLAQLISDKIWQQDDAARVDAAKQVAARAVAEAAYSAQYTLLQYLFHELRVPLNGIMLAACDLSDTGTTPATRENISTIVAGGEAMTKLLNDCVNLSKTQSGQLAGTTTRFQPRDLIHSVLSVLQFERVTVRVCVAEDASGLVIGDESRLRQVLDNFATNAIRFTPHGGTIAFQTFACPAGVDPSAIVAALTPSSVPGEERFGHPDTPVVVAPKASNAVVLPESSTSVSSLPGYTRGAGSMKPPPALNSLQTLGARVSESMARHSMEQTMQPTGTHRYTAMSSSRSQPQSNSTRASTSFVLFVVEDTGVGISEGDQAKLFQPFAHIRAGATLKANHTGLGLATARFVVELGGGRIGCWSQPGEGSRFWFTVPCAPRVADPLEDNSLDVEFTAPRSSASVTQPNTGMLVPTTSNTRMHSAVSSTGNISRYSRLSMSNLGGGTGLSLPASDCTTPQTSARIAPSTPTPMPQSAQLPMRMAVVVDDTDSNRLLLARLLQRMGAADEVATAINGADALTHPEWLHADAWFVDRNMPVMDGMQLCRTLRARGYRGPIIGVTGDGMLEDQAEFVLSGASLVVLKPCSKATLQQALNTVAASKTTEVLRCVQLSSDTVTLPR